MVSFTKYVKPLILLTFAFFIYIMMMDGKNLDKFVPSNSFEIPNSLTTKEFAQINDKFGTLIQSVNRTTFDLGYSLDNILSTFAYILNTMGVGKFTVLSVGETQQFTLLDVVVQDVNTFAITKLKRVDFIVESLNPFKIHKVIITPDSKFIVSQKVAPIDPLKQELFRIQNPLHLFYPYKSSDNEMILTSDDKKLFQEITKEKDVIANTVSEKNQQVANAPIPNISLPGDIVGVGPLHPIGT